MVPEGELCYYCGEPASDLEHVVPRSVLLTMDQFPEKKAEMIKNRILTVFACKECNSLLGASVQETLRERKSYLKMRLKKRYTKLLKMPVWNDDEIEELGEDMQKYIRYSAHKKASIEARLKW